jgi:hypothetical protein
MPSQPAQDRQQTQEQGSVCSIVFIPNIFSFRTYAQDSGEEGFDDDQGTDPKGKKRGPKYVSMHFRRNVISLLRTTQHTGRPSGPEPHRSARIPPAEAATCTSPIIYRELSTNPLYRSATSSCASNFSLQLKMKPSSRWTE